MDLNKVLGALTSSGVAGGFAGGMAGGALTSALMGKKGRKHAKTLLKAGGVAALGGLAYKAYRSYQQGQSGSDAPGSASAAPAGPAAEASWQALPESSFAVDASGEPGSNGLLLVRAMIAAALADGHMDAAERGRIAAKINELGLAADEMALVVDELQSPVPLDELVAAVPDRSTAIEVYAASLLAIDESRSEGRAYLDALAARLALPDLLLETLGDRITAQPEQAA